MCVFIQGTKGDPGLPGLPGPAGYLGQKGERVRKQRKNYKCLVSVQNSCFDFFFFFRVQLVLMDPKVTRCVS